MVNGQVRDLVRRRFTACHGAAVTVANGHWQHVADASGLPLAVLGYRSADQGPLFLETYLDRPVEEMIGTRFGCAVTRNTVVEICSLAAISPPALLTLWKRSARDLEARYDIAVATLTEPLRRMFARVGVRFIELAPADPARLDPAVRADWGRYYDLDPIVCAGPIAAGAAALARYGLSAKAAA